MRHNGYHNQSKDFKDPSEKNPGAGISARNDLGSLKSFVGGVDVKLTNYELQQSLTQIVISGPTIDNNPNLKVFEWSQDKTNSIKHAGTPEKYDFPWLILNPKNICCSNDDIYKWKDKKRRNLLRRNYKLK